MEDNRKNLQKHIRAASDWLQQADKSIEREEDLKGDLKLMLAKAELQNAEKHQDRSRLTKFLSFFTAAMIALAILWLNGDSEKISRLSKPSVSRIEVPDSPIIEENTSAETLSNLPALEISTEEVSDQKNLQEQVEVPSEQSPIYENAESYNANGELALDNESNTSSYYTNYTGAGNLNIYQSESISDTTVEADNTSSVVQAPTEDMQKLMQSAGQILHAE